MKELKKQNEKTGCKIFFPVLCFACKAKKSFESEVRSWTAVVVVKVRALVSYIVRN